MDKFYLIAGHGNGDPGAVANGYQEWKVTRDFIVLLAKYLKELKHEVEIYNPNGSVTSTKDMYQQSLKGKGLYSFKVDDRIVIEFHLNSFDKTANGCEIWIGTGLTADKWDKAISEVLGRYFTQRGIKKSSQLLNMNIAKQRGINYRLVESCFISNKDDIKKFIKEMDNIAREMAEELTGKSLQPKKASQAIGKAYFMGKDMEECWLYIYPWDILIRKTNNKDRYAHEMDIHTKERAIYNKNTGKRVNTWYGDIEGRLYYIDTEAEKKVTRQS